MPRYKLTSLNWRKGIIYLIVSIHSILMIWIERFEFKMIDMLKLNSKRHFTALSFFNSSPLFFQSQRIFRGKYKTILTSWSITKSIFKCLIFRDAMIGINFKGNKKKNARGNEIEANFSFESGENCFSCNFHQPKSSSHSFVFSI